MVNGISIKDRQQFKELHDKDPGLAMGLLFENVTDLKQKCECRLTQCKAVAKKNRFKNSAVQFAGGVVGGASAAGAFLLYIWDKLKQ